MTKTAVIHRFRPLIIRFRRIFVRFIPPGIYRCQYYACFSAAFPCTAPIHGDHVKQAQIRLFSIGITRYRQRHGIALPPLQRRAATGKPMPIIYAQYSFRQFIQTKMPRSVYIADFHKNAKKDLTSAVNPAIIRPWRVFQQLTHNRHPKIILSSSITLTLI